MYLDYGSVRLKVIDLVRFERETVWSEDGADLLYVLATIGVTAVYAPGGIPALPSITQMSQETQDTLSGDDRTVAALRRLPRGFDPGARSNILDKPRMEDDSTGRGLAAIGAVLNGDDTRHSGPQTDAELRARLWLPRKKLILWAYDRQTGLPIRWLESPRPGMTVDVANGPKPLSVDIVSAAGEPTSVGMFFQVQTAISACPIGSDRLVLSHRWEMSHAHDDNYYLTRTIDGTIQFSSAVREVTRTRPDWVRAQFLHPIPVGFRRELPMFKQSSDGLTIRYRITDTDPTIVFDPGASGATQIRIEEKLASQVTFAINK